MTHKENWLPLLAELYGPELAAQTAAEMQRRFAPYEHIAPKKADLDEKDLLLITYGDTLRRQGEPGLATLRRFLDDCTGSAIPAVHLLPMCPYTSDDGFSVTDYKQLDPALGTWADLDALSGQRDMMYDAVVNHISKSSAWFQKFLACEEPYKDFFIVCDPGADYSAVTRPRTSPLLTPFETKEGTKYVWTTFSDDQIDLNYHCPAVLLAVLDVLLFYAQRGARFIRLDAVGFLWKELGTTCMHLPQTHALVRLMRLVLADYAPGTKIITETNVPHKDNISYFGKGDEADLVYQFPLPPLVMFTLRAGNAARLRTWAAGLEAPRPGTAYFNFLSSHDGIGVRPTEGILTPEERDFLVTATLRSGGEVSWKDNGDGTRSPYELNINYQDALAEPDDPDATRVGRFLAAETILLTMQGMPGLYIHSLLGSRNDYYGRAVSGIPRRINREKPQADAVISALAQNPNRRAIFTGLLARISIRAAHPAFAPAAAQEILPWQDRLFALTRTAPGGEKILAAINVSGDAVPLPEPISGTELFTGVHYQNETVTLAPWQAVWVQL